MTPCLFCSGDRSAPDHDAHCDGRQGHLEVELHARTLDPDTSQDAMAAYDEDRMRSAALVVTRLYRDRGPMADFEMRAAFDQVWDRPQDESLHRQARNQARNQGWIRDTGERRVNPATKRLQIVWAFQADPHPPALDFCPTCGALRGRDGVQRRRAS